MSAAIAQQLALVYMGRVLDTQWASSTANLLNGSQPSAALQASFYNAALGEGVYSASDSPSAYVNKIFQNLFGFGASTFEQTAWGNLISNNTVSRETAAWTIFRSYLGANNVPDVYKLPVQSKLVAMNSYSQQLATDPAANLALSGGGSVSVVARSYVTEVTSQSTAASAIAGVAGSVTALTTSATGTTFNLTVGTDVFTGTSANDTFNAGEVAGAVTFTAGDTLNGGTGLDTLNIIATEAFKGTPTGASVQNIETVNLTGGKAVTLDSTGFTGLTALNAKHSGDATITAAATTAVNVSGSLDGKAVVAVSGGSNVTVTETSTLGGGSINVGGAAGTVAVSSAIAGAFTGPSITVTGGTKVAVTQVATNAVNTIATNGTVTVIGNSSTTEVTVANAAVATKSATVAGVVANSVAIADVNGGADKAGTITSATVSNFTTLNFVGNALTTLSVTGGSGNIIIDNSGLTTPTNKTLGLTINGETGGTLDDADIYTKLDVTTAGKASTLANITTGAVDTLNVAGTQALTLTSTSGLTKLATVAVSGSAGLNADLSGATVTSVSTAATTGASKVTIDGTKATFTGGAGVDTVTLAGTSASKAISLGGGNDFLNIASLNGAPTAVLDGGAGTDTLTMTAALAATASADAKFAGLVTNFEKLVLTGATNQTVDLAVLGSFNDVTTSGGNGLTLSNMPTGGTLTLNGAGTAYTIGNSAFTAGTNDVINLNLTDGSSAAVSFAATGITASGVETFNITVADTQATPSGTFNDSVTLLGNSVKAITVAGNAGLTLTATSTALTSVDASGIVGTTTGGFSFASGALAGAATVKGSAAGANVVDLKAAVAGTINYTGGSGADTVTLGNGKASTLTLGDGANTVTAGTNNANNTITGGKGVDTITVGNGNNTITTGAGNDVISIGGGTNTVTAGDGNDSITLTTDKFTGLSVITGGAGNDTFGLAVAGLNVNTYATITDASKGDILSFKDQGTETFTSAKIVLAPTAVFQDYANAAAAGDGANNAAISWFQFGGDTYVVEDLSAATDFVSGMDIVVKLSGLVDLSTATGAGTNSLTLA